MVIILDRYINSGIQMMIQCLQGTEQCILPCLQGTEQCIVQCLWSAEQCLLQQQLCTGHVKELLVPLIMPTQQIICLTGRDDGRLVHQELAIQVLTQMLPLLGLASTQILSSSTEMCKYIAHNCVVIEIHIYQDRSRDDKYISILNFQCSTIY